MRVFSVITATALLSHSQMSQAFVSTTFHKGSSATQLFSTEEKAAPIVTGEELEKMLTEWDEPLVVDAYATWYVYWSEFVMRGRLMGMVLTHFSF